MILPLGGSVLYQESLSRHYTTSKPITFFQAMCEGPACSRECVSGGAASTLHQSHAHHKCELCCIHANYCPGALIWNNIDMVFNMGTKVTQPKFTLWVFISDSQIVMILYLTAGESQEAVCAPCPWRRLWEVLTPAGGGLWEGVEEWAPAMWDCVHDRQSLY